eukprot:9519935-Alexandrium_andersonii.AAC.1
MVHNRLRCSKLELRGPGDDPQSPPPKASSRGFGVISHAEADGPMVTTKRADGRAGGASRG